MRRWRPGLTSLGYGVLGGFVGLLAVVGWLLDGNLGIAVCLVAAVVCLAGAMGGDLIGQVVTAPNLVAYQHLLGMLPRMGVPLVVCMVVALDGGVLQAAGLVYYILPIYLVCLGISTVVTTQRIAATHPAGKDQ
ncbi:MAG: hypothetical protein GTO53_11750 [Planctomycetales bacterium]|nr:hypothetical protein [Planctomycetales bacterium]